MFHSILNHKTDIVNTVLFPVNFEITQCSYLIYLFANLQYFNRLKCRPFYSRILWDVIASLNLAPVSDSIKIVDRSSESSKNKKKQYKSDGVFLPRLIGILICYMNGFSPKVNFLTEYYTGRTLLFSYEYCLKWFKFLLNKLFWFISSLSSLILEPKSTANSGFVCNNPL